MSREIEVLVEIRDLLQVIAEPALAKRDAKLRSSLRSIVGAGRKKAKAVLLMDGSRSRVDITAESGIDRSDLSKLVKALEGAELIRSDEPQPGLLVKIPPTFFDDDASHE